jgi:hypothetical protein
MIKSRNISLSLEEATRLYSSGNLALQEIVLRVFKEEEVLGYDDMRLYIDKQLISLEVPQSKATKIAANAKLAIIAQYLNKGAESSHTRRYYFAKVNEDIFEEAENPVDSEDYIIISSTKDFVASGTIYFNTLESAERAAILMGRNIRDLF